MNSVLLRPHDLLFFGDGRPMDGASTGHGDAWPSAHQINAAFHAALHRAGIADVHAHRTGRSTDRDSDAPREQKFGSLLTVGPFPVRNGVDWFFPRPLDAQKAEDCAISLEPLIEECPSPSSLNDKLYPVVNRHTPTKASPEPWLSTSAWTAYLKGQSLSDSSQFAEFSEITDTEFQIGIGIDPLTQTTEDGKFYLAHYLRLRETTKTSWQLGVLAEACDKVNNDPNNKRDLIEILLNTDQHILVGGQQRLCSASCSRATPLPLPIGPDFTEPTVNRVKWTLLTPAIFPAINTHPGGWLPSWINEKTLAVALLNGPGPNKVRRNKNLTPGSPIKATLKAAIVGRPLPITGMGTGNERGAKTIHYAVPAGSVYYFEGETLKDASDLAHALNWYGSSSDAPHTITHRRSTTFGEKGFGLGVCSHW